MRHVEASPIVSDAENAFSALLRRRQIDPRIRLVAREFPRVTQEILEEDFHEAPVCVEDESLRDHGLHTAIRVALRQLAENLGRHAREVRTLRSRLDLTHTRPLQEIVDELTHALGRGADPFEVVLALWAQARGMILEQNETQAVDRTQRRAKVVGDRVAEGLELTIL